MQYSNQYFNLLYLGLMIIVYLAIYNDFLS